MSQQRNLPNRKQNLFWRVLNPKHRQQMTNTDSVISACFSLRLPLKTGVSRKLPVRHELKRQRRATLLWVILKSFCFSLWSFSGREEVWQRVGTEGGVRNTKPRQSALASLSLCLSSSKMSLLAPLQPESDHEWSHRLKPVMFLFTPRSVTANTCCHEGITDVCCFSKESV